MNLILGTILFIIGVILVYTQTIALNKGKSNFTGGISRILIGGVGFVICGIVLIVKFFLQ